MYIKEMIKFKSGKIIISMSAISKFLFLAILLLYLFFYTFMETRILWTLYLIFLVILIFARRKVSFEPVEIILLLVLPLSWGLIMSFNDDFINSVKGIFYLSVPVIMILIGFQFSKIFTVEQFLSSIITIGTIIAVMFIFLTLTRTGFVAFVEPMSESRFTVSSGSPATVLSLVTTLYHEKFGFSLFRRRYMKYIVILVNITAVWLFASRNFWIMLLVYLIVFSLKVVKSRNLFILTIMIVTSLIIAFSTIRSEKGLTNLNSLAYKFVNSFSEIRISDYQTDSDINTYYRGYESYRSLKTYSSGTIPELIFGGGYGKLIDLDASVLLDGRYWTEVPIVHNGFFLVLVKLGPIGLIFNIIFYILVANIAVRRLLSDIKKEQFLGLMLLGSIMALFISNYVSTGMYTMEMTFLLITIGFLSKLLYKSGKILESEPN